MMNRDKKWSSKEIKTDIVGWKLSDGRMIDGIVLYGWLMGND